MCVVRVNDCQTDFTMECKALVFILHFQHSIHYIIMYLWPPAVPLSCSLLCEWGSLHVYYARTCYVVLVSSPLSIQQQGTAVSIGTVIHASQRG